MSATYKCADQESMGAAIDHAARVMADGECIVLRHGRKLIAAVLDAHADTIAFKA